MTSYQIFLIPVHNFGEYGCPVGALVLHIGFETARISLPGKDSNVAWTCEIHAAENAGFWGLR